MPQIKEGDTTKSQKFGIEIELTGITRCKAAETVAEYFGTNAVHLGGAYDAYSVRDNQNRTWKIVSDASIRCTKGGGRADKSYSVEFVSPICVYDDIETIQQLVRNLRSIGAVASV